LTKKYGDIVGLYFGSKPVVILNNPKHIKEAFAEAVFAGRDIGKLIKDRNLGGNRGVLLSDGPVWLEQRRFTLKTLRDFGFGKKTMDAIIMEEVNELIASFKSQHGQPITTQNRFNIAVLNGLWAIMTGERYSHDDPRLNHLIRGLTATIAKRPLSSVLADIFPIVYYMRKTFPSLFTITGGIFQRDVYKLIGESVSFHQETIQEDSPRDFLDVYLNEVKKTKDPNSSFHGEDGVLGLKVTMMDLFVAGAETTSTTLSWAFLILALHPEIQEKVHDEIKRVVGLSRNVSLADRPNLPYLEATDMEVLRYSALVSTGVPHKVHEDVQFQGYTIPKGTTIIGNLYNASRSKEAWGDPENFRPERFLSPEGKCIVRNDCFMPFSTGRRICLGETLAKDELFLFMGNIFQQLKVTTVPGEPKPSLEPRPVSQLVLMPREHKLVLLDRQIA
jgi:methyl farnesoate epoxidase/farnesoate epoxidase